MENLSLQSRRKASGESTADCRLRIAERDTVERPVVQPEWVELRGNGVMELWGNGVVELDS